MILAWPCSFLSLSVRFILRTRARGGRILLLPYMYPSALKYQLLARLMNIYNHHKGIYIAIMYQASGSGGQFPSAP